MPDKYVLDILAWIRCDCDATTVDVNGDAGELGMVENSTVPGISAATQARSQKRLNHSEAERERSRPFSICASNREAVSLILVSVSVMAGC